VSISMVNQTAMRLTSLEDFRTLLTLSWRYLSWGRPVKSVTGPPSRLVSFSSARFTQPAALGALPSLPFFSALLTKPLAVTEVKNKLSTLLSIS